MNKEQKKPQKECYCDYHEKIKRGHCPNMPNVHIRKEKPQEEWERDLETEKLITGKNKHSISYVCPTHGSSIYMPLENTCKDCKLYVSGEDIRTNFIAKRDLRKLLEEKEIEYGKREIIDDILAEIEKL